VSKAAELVDQRRTRLHGALAQPVQRQHLLLLDRFQRHEAHLGPLRCLADRRCVVAIGLVAFDVRLDELTPN
jgi:hypothetical protein